MQYRKLSIPKDSLTEIFKMQKSLLKEYIPIEFLPKYPLDITTKTSQKILKAFTGRFIEELTEAYNELLTINDIMQNGSLSSNVIENIRNFNGEIADAIHFCMEIFIYSGLDEDTIDEYFLRFVSSQRLFPYMENDEILTNIYKYSQMFQYWNHTKDILLSASTFYIKTEDPWEKGGTKISNDVLDSHAEFLWEITCKFYNAINLLKNREWSQKDIRTLNEMEFREKLFEAFVIFICYLDFCDIDEEALYHIYTFKNENNHERVRQGY